MTIAIQTAKRAGARVVVSLAGPSGSGKTLTALLLAYGMTGGDGSRIGLLDTENRRGRLYADAHTYRMVQDQLGLADMPTPFLVGDLEPPFSPRRYIDAILQFQKAGVRVLVIDSVSHEWEGTGGCQEIANPPGSNLRIPKWNLAKAEHKAFVNALLQCDMDVIVCTRAREKVRIEKANGETVVTPLGMLPICEKNFMFEMTASLMMWDSGRMQESMKCPDELKPILGRGDDYITAADGARLRAWIDGADQLDPAIEHARNSLRTVTERGMDAYREAWKKTPKRIRDALQADGTHDVLKASADAFDRQRIDAQPGGAQLAELNAAIQQTPPNG